MTSDDGPVEDPMAAAVAQLAEALERQAVALEAVASRTLIPPAPRRHTGLMLLVLLVVLIAADSWWQDVKHKRETDIKETR